MTTSTTSPAPVVAPDGDADVSLRRVAAWIGLFVAVIAGIGLFASGHTVAVTILALVFGGIAVSWALPAGLGGLLSLGHAAFFGIGAYATVYLFDAHGLSPWLGMVVGAVLAALFAALTTWLSVRFKVRGSYFALITLAWAEILRVIVTNSQTLGRSNGIYVPFVREPSWSDFQFVTATPYLVIAAVYAAAAALIYHLVDRSTYGWRLSAIRGDEEAASAIGIDVRRDWVLLMTLSGAMSAVGGSIYVQYVQFIDPETGFGVMVSILIAVRAIIGGAGTPAGPLIGAALWTAMNELAQNYFGGLPGLNIVLFGLGIIVVARYAQNGLAGVAESLVHHRSGRKATR